MTRVWVVRGGDENRLVDQFVDNGVTGIGYYTVPDGKTVGRHDVERCLRDEGTSAAIEWHASMFDSFVHEMAPADFIVMPDTPRGEVVIGRVVGAYEYHTGLPVEQYRHRRGVEWVGRHPISELPTAHQDLYRQRPTLMERTDPGLLDHLERVASGEIGRPASDRRRGPTRVAGSRAFTAARAGSQQQRSCSECGETRAASRFPSGSSVCWDCQAS